MTNHHVDLLERAFVDEEIDAFSGGQLAGLVLAVHRPLRSGVQRFVAQRSQLFNPLFGTHVPYSRCALDSTVTEMATPYACTHLTEVDSTQDEARNRFDGTAQLVVADRQVRGRGRLGRHWDQAPRGLAVSLAFHLPWPESTWPRLTLVAGLAALDVLGDVSGSEALRLRWPNDLYRGSRKAGGILVEAAHEVVVAGLGVNLWWPDPPKDRVGLYHKDPGSEAVVHLGQAWAEALLERIGHGPEEWGRAEAEAATMTIGAPVTLADGTRAVALGIDADGALIVEDSQRRWSVQSGTVTVDEDPSGEQ